ncbi:PadR family transcriptional regulator (plasmid) [Streptomycetaceae bacterium NBC_01309]
MTRRDDTAPGDGIPAAAAPLRVSRRTRRVLRALAVLESANGWQVARAARFTVSGVYPVLLRLERAGWVTSWWVPGPERRRRVYALSHAGRQGFADLTERRAARG